MASTPVQIQLPSGLTATLALYADGSDTIANGSGDSLVEETNRLGLYEATVTEALSNVHFAKVLIGANVIATGWVNMADTTAEVQVSDDYDAMTRAEATADKAEVLAAIGDMLGVASSVDDATVTPTTTVFAGQSADMSAVDDLYSSGGGMLVVFTSGDMRGVPRPVVDYVGTTRAITVSPAFPAAPSDGDTFFLIGRP